MPKRFFAVALCFIISGISACTYKPEIPEKPEEKLELIKINEKLIKQLVFKDNGSPESLLRAASESLEYFKRFPKDKIFKVANVEFSSSEYQKALSEFMTLATQSHFSAEEILKIFDFYAYKTQNSTGWVLVTGYYEPILEGSLEYSEEYSYPIYPLPADLIKVSLENFNINCKGPSQIVGRLDGQRLIPYYTRKEIDEGALSRLKPLVWVKEPIEAFFLHIQGSGIIRFKNGEERRIGYAGSNGRAYRSIGKYMADQSWISKEELSMQSIKAYLKANPDKLWQTLWHNESYVFFRWVEKGPKGSLDVLLTEGRSIASDRTYYPPGVISFLVTLIPDPPNNQFIPYSGWVFHQDAGGAIKGPGRVDLFFGSGYDAGEKAGRMKQEGILFMLLPKKLSISK